MGWILRLPQACARAGAQGSRPRHRSRLHAAMQDRPRPLLMLIDGPSLVYRGYFALPQLTSSEGTLVNAVIGYMQIVMRGMQDLKPDYAIVSFDLGRPQFRFQAYPEYKAGRPSMPDDLRAQFPIVREICQMMGIPIRELEGYEADDVIGSLVQRAREADVDTMIVSGDLDGLQLVNDRVRLLTTRMGVAATVIYDVARVAERYGLTPEQMLDYKALKGDTTPGTPAAATGATSSATPAAHQMPDPLADPRGAIEHVEPRIVRSAADREALDAWLTEQRGDVALGWMAGHGRPLERTVHGLALAGADGSAWYLPWNDAEGPDGLPEWFRSDERRVIGHDLKQIVVLLAARGLELRGPTFDTLVAGYMVNPALRSQTIEDLAAQRFSAELPPRPSETDGSADEAQLARRAAAEALSALLAVPLLERELEEAGVAGLFRDVEMPLLPVLA